MPHHPDSLMYPSVGKTSASTNTESPWDPRSLSHLHMEVIRQRVQGIPPSKIRYNLKRKGHDMSVRHIKRLMDSPSGQRFASLYSAQFHGGAPGLMTALGEHLPTAMYVETEIMMDPLVEPRHRLNAAQDVSDRGGLPKISRQESSDSRPTMVVINLLPSQLSQFLAPPATIEAEAVKLIEPVSSNNEDI